MAQGNAHSTILNGKDRLHNLMLNTIVISHTHTGEKKHQRKHIKLSKMVLHSGCFFFSMALFILHYIL